MSNPFFGINVGIADGVFFGIEDFFIINGISGKKKSKKNFWREMRTKSFEKVFGTKWEQKVLKVLKTETKKETVWREMGTKSFC